jgi:hypothetical protein
MLNVEIVIYLGKISVPLNKKGMWQMKEARNEEYQQYCTSGITTFNYAQKLFLAYVIPNANNSAI